MEWKSKFNTFLFCKKHKYLSHELAIYNHSLKFNYIKKKKKKNPSGWNLYALWNKFV